MKKLFLSLVLAGVSVSALAEMPLSQSTLAQSTVAQNTISQSATASASSSTSNPRETITPAFNYPIANVKGKNLTAIIVDYPAGGTTPAHRHGKAFVVGYVLEGAIKSRLNNGEVKIYKAGESWTETPGTHHSVSENASKTEPAKLLAIFVVDKSQKDLVKFDKK